MLSVGSVNATDCGGGSGGGGDGNCGGGGSDGGDKTNAPATAEKEVPVGDVQALLAARLYAPTRIVAVLGNRDAAIHNARLETAVGLCTQGNQSGRPAFLLHKEYPRVKGALGRSEIAAAVRAAGVIAPHTGSWAGDFLLGKNSYDTIEEAVMLRLVLERQFPPPRRLHVAVVTSAYHAARAERIFGEAFASSAGIHVAVIGAPNGTAAACGALGAACKKGSDCIHAEARHLEKFKRRCAPLGFGAFYLARGLLQTFGVPCTDAGFSEGFLTREGLGEAAVNECFKDRSVLEGLLDVYGARLVWPRAGAGGGAKIE
jgi:hypothetical protein